MCKNVRVRDTCEILRSRKRFMKSERIFAKVSTLYTEMQKFLRIYQQFSRNRENFPLGDAKVTKTVAKFHDNFRVRVGKIFAFSFENFHSILT
jgi:hypothetical protein